MSKKLKELHVKIQSALPRVKGIKNVHGYLAKGGPTTAEKWVKIADNADPYEFGRLGRNYFLTQMTSCIVRTLA